MNISSAVEIKYVNHIFRNVYLYFLIFLTSYILFDFQPGVLQFLIGLAVFVIGYSSVYFLNDYSDQKEDPSNQKRNLYLDIPNKKVFWGIFATLIVTGVVSSMTVSILSLFLLCTLLLLNLIYSFQPLRFRNVPFARELTLFVIYFIKWLFIFELLGLQFDHNTPLSLLIMGSAFAALMGSFYKRHLRRNILVELFFGAVFSTAFLIALHQYKDLWILLLPLIPMGTYLGVRYKNSQIPFGRYQLLHFIYLLGVYLFLFLQNP